MALNPRGTFSTDLSLFGSRITDILATDLPAGVSPDNENCWFQPGMVATRPAFSRALSTPISGTPNILSNCEYRSLSGALPTVFVDSNGVVWLNDPASPSVNTLIANVIAGMVAKFENAFGKLFGAFYSPSISSDFSKSPFVGAGFPLYYNGTQIGRVTSDAPGVSPTFSNLATSPVALFPVGTTGNLTVSSAVGSGQFYQGGYSYWATITYTCTSAVPAAWLNQTVTVTGFTGTYASAVNRTGQVTSVAGNLFTMAFLAGVQITSTGTGTAALVGSTYLLRQGNLVTVYLGGASLPAQFSPGYWASVVNADGSLINGPNWTITNISRNGSGVVTVTVSSQLTNLPVGAQVYVAATDSTDFPAGYQTVYQVLSFTASQTVFTYQSSDFIAASSSSGGSVYQTWSPQLGTNGNAAQIIATGIDPTNGAYFQFWQFGPDTSIALGQGNINSPQAQIQGQIPGGIRSAVVMFANGDGAITAPSLITQVSVLGGGNLLQASNIPIGPPGTTQRIIAFTPYNGSSWYYLAPAVQPNLEGQGQTIVLGTIISDNVSTSAVIDFSDSQLTAGTQIDATGNNLFNQIVLPPCLGAMEYQQRLHWWGAINNIRNLSNMGFDGGYVAPVSQVSVTNGSPTVNLVSGAIFFAQQAGAQISIAGAFYTIQSANTAQIILTSNYTGSTETVPAYVLSPYGQIPTGWQSNTLGLAPYLVPAPVPGIGYACQFPYNFTHPASMKQGAYQDQFGAPILEPNTQYLVRFMGQAAFGGSGQLTFTIEDQSGFSSTVAVTVNYSPTMQWYVGTFSLPTGNSIASTTILAITNTGSQVVTIDELEIIDAEQPVEANTVHSSYIGNPFGYDSITGVMQIDATESITAMFKQRSYAYMLSDLKLYQSQSSSQSEPSGWPVVAYADACGCSGPNAVDTTEDIAWWAGRYGARIFNGNPSTKKISQEIASDWEAMNWNYQTLLWVTNDPVERIVYFGVVQGSNTSVSAILPMNYRLNDDAYNVPDPVHTSMYSGRMLATDLGRKWTIWTPGMNSAAMCTRPSPGGLARQCVFGGNGNGELYTLDMVNFPGLRDSDDDFGAIDGYYQTYFFPDHLTEQNPILDNYRKFFPYVGIHLTGKGQVVITPYVDATTNPWPAFPAFNLTGNDPGFDYQIPLNVRGDRMSLKISTQSLSGGAGGAFVLTHLIFSGRKDLVFPVRAALT